MDLLSFIILTFIIIILVLVAAVLIIFRKNIMSFFWPQNYCYVTMLESDNNVSSWIQRKNPNLKFIFNEGEYNLYDKIPEKSLPPLYDGKGRLATSMPVSTAVYRSGRLAQFFYIEGNEDPLDYRNNKITSNPQMNRQRKTVDYTKLLTAAPGIKEWIIYALLGLAVGFIIGQIIGGWGKVPAPVNQGILFIYLLRRAPNA